MEDPVEMMNNVVNEFNNLHARRFTEMITKAVTGQLAMVDERKPPPQEYYAAFVDVVFHHNYEFIDHMRWLLWASFFDLFNTSPVWVPYSCKTVERLVESWEDFMEKENV